MTKIIDQDGNELSWSVVYWRYRVQGQTECDSLDDALGFLWGSMENGLLSPESITEPSGRVIEGDELDEMLDDYDRQITSNRKAL